MRFKSKNKPKRSWMSLIFVWTRSAVLQSSCWFLAPSISFSLFCSKQWMLDRVLWRAHKLGFLASGRFHPEGSRVSQNGVSEHSLENKCLVPGRSSMGRCSRSLHKWNLWLSQLNSSRKRVWFKDPHLSFCRRLQSLSQPASWSISSLSSCPGHMGHILMRQKPCLDELNVTTVLRRIRDLWPGPECCLRVHTGQVTSLSNHVVYLEREMKGDGVVFHLNRTFNVKTE